MRYVYQRYSKSRQLLTALFTKPSAPNSAIHKAAGQAFFLVGTTPPPPRPFQLPAPFMAYGSFRNCTRQNHGMARNHKANGFVNSAVSYGCSQKSHQQEQPPEAIPPLMASGLEQWNDGIVPAGNCEAGDFVNSTVKCNSQSHQTACHHTE